MALAQDRDEVVLQQRQTRKSFARLGEGADRKIQFTTIEQWGYATIGGSSYLVPVSSEIVLRMSDGSTERGKTEYKNHRHFEAATSITFGKDQ